MNSQFRVLLVNPPFLSEFGRFSRAQRSPAITKGGTLYYPIWLCYAAGYLEKHGFSVKLIDAPAIRLSEESCLKQATKFAPHLIIIDTSTPSIFADVRMAEHLKAQTGARIILVGPHPSALPEETLRLSPAIDGIARREFEQTLLEVAQSLNAAHFGPADPLRKTLPRPQTATNGLAKENLRPPSVSQHPGPITDWADIPGLSFQQNGAIIHTPDRPPLDNLDELPFVSEVYRKHLNPAHYLYTIAQYPQVAIYSGRGCPHRCFYCIYPQVMHGSRYRRRSIANLIAEFQFIETHLPEVREVFLEDDTFTIDRQRVLDFCSAFRQAGLSISWIANSRADIDETTLKAMKAANCRLLCVGFESASNQVLRGLRKHLDLRQAVTFVQAARRCRILIHGCFLFGGPGETRETMARTLHFAKSLDLDSAQFFPLIAYPGTQAFQWAKENGYLLSNDFREWVTPEGLHNSLISRPDLPRDFLIDFCDFARRSFYLRAKYLSRKFLRLLLHPREDGPRLWRSLSVFWQHLLFARHSGNKTE
jgi:radical SAM superfamily enzyme YgiQ (UPF0313 family)